MEILAAIGAIAIVTAAVTLVSSGLLRHLGAYVLALADYRDARRAHRQEQIERRRAAYRSRLKAEGVEI